MKIKPKILSTDGPTIIAVENVYCLRTERYPYGSLYLMCGTFNNASRFKDLNTGTYLKNNDYINFEVWKKQQIPMSDSEVIEFYEKNIKPKTKL